MTLASRQRRLVLHALLAGSGLFLSGCQTRPAASSTAPLPHPRLIAPASAWQTLAARRRAEPGLDRFVSLLLERARADLARPPLTRTLEGRRLLGVSREFIRRTLLWAFAWRVTGEAVFAERARREMLTIAAFADWHPEHYLDVAEMSAGMALGYDWLYDAIPAPERATLRAALVAKGIAQARNGHKTFTLTHNWGQVCIGGMVLGALAIEEDEPQLAADLLAQAQRYAGIAPQAYAPDGVYPEGPGYWSYGTSYETLLIAALRSTRGTDWGLTAMPGFLRSALFQAQSVGPTGRVFNFADGGEGQDLAPPLFFLARELGQPALVASRLEMIQARQGLSERFAPLIALWWPQPGPATTPPLHFAGQGAQPVSIWRSAWNDRNALYFALKAGGAAHNHAHMDAGSFVFDLDGVRWARDLGMQDYNSLEQRGIDLWNMRQDSPRWKVFRLAAEAHNTFTLAGQPHNAAGLATLQQADAHSALIDLTPALLPGQVRTATRRVEVSRESVMIEDRISGSAPGTAVRWAMNTEAQIRIEGSTAWLSQSGKTLRVSFAGTDIHLAVQDISAPRADFDLPNPGMRQLVATGPSNAAGDWTLRTRLARN